MAVTRRACYLLAAITIGVPGVFIVGCDTPPSEASSAAAEPASSPCLLNEDLRDGLVFDRSPGGVPEVDAAWLLEEHCNVRVVDVREASERFGPLGAIPWGTHVPLDQLLEAAARWDPDEPIVLVCRSGRRTARGVRMLEDIGFSRVASLAGGMLIWRAHHDGDASYPLTSRPPMRETEATPPESAHVAGPLDRAAVLSALRDESQVRWVKAAGLLMQGTQSCVDGREPRPVVGTPGGDAGELLLALAALERVSGEEVVADRVGPIVDAFISAFGRFYIHTDTHALEALGHHFSSELSADLTADDADAMEAFVRHPPRHLEEPLLDALTDARHVGCGHLRLVLTHDEEYGVREDLTRTLLREVYLRLWRGDAIDFVVLEGEHHEGAVVNVLLDREVHAFTRVPTVSPRVGSVALFINHPQVSAWLRGQNARFFFEIDPWLHQSDERRARFLETLSELGDAHLRITLGYLAAEIPVYEAHVSEDGVRLEQPTDLAPRETPHVSSRFN